MSQDKSTAGAAQRKRIVQLLRTRPHTSYELRRAGCYQDPARVFELRNTGFRHPDGAGHLADLIGDDAALDVVARVV